MASCPSVSYQLERSHPGFTDMFVGLFWGLLVAAMIGFGPFCGLWIKSQPESLLRTCLLVCSGAAGGHHGWVLASMACLGSFCVVCLRRCPDCFCRHRCWFVLSLLWSYRCFHISVRLRDESPIHYIDGKETAPSLVL